MEAVYTHMWASHDGGPFAPLDESLHPRPHTMLYEVAAARGVSASWQVFDVGSGRGNYTCALAQRFGCSVVDLDLAQIHAEQGRARAVQEGISDQVTFVQGDIEALPFETSLFQRSLQTRDGRPPPSANTRWRLLMFIQATHFHQSHHFELSNTFA